MHRGLYSFIFIWTCILVDHPVNQVQAQPAERLTVEQAIELTLQSHHELQAYLERINTNEALYSQSQLFPNPELEIESINLGVDEFEITVQQIFELGGKRLARMDVAQTDSELAVVAYEVIKRDVIAEVTTRFLTVFEGQLKLGLLEENLDLSEKVLSAVNKRVAAGATPPVEVARAHVAHKLLKIEHERTERELKAHQSFLSSLWNGDPGDIHSVTGDLEQDFVLPDIVALRTALVSNPELIFWKLEEEQRQRVLNLEKRIRTPDLTVGAGFLRDGERNENAALFNFAIDLPLFNRNQGNIKSAEANIKVTQRTKSAAEVRLRGELHQLYYHLESSYYEVESLLNEVIPSAEKVYQEIEVLFKAGKMNFLDLLDARQTLIELQNSLIETQISFLTTRAAIEQLTGPMVTRGGAHEQ